MLSLKKKEEIVKDYLSGRICRLVAKECEVSYQTVYNILHTSGVPMRNDRRIPIHNEDAFSKITPESSYWVGFLLSDGCVHWLRGKYPKLVVELEIGDWGHLEKLRRFLGSETNVKPSHRGRAARFEITSEKIVEDLRQLDVVPCKSITAKVSPLLAESRDFWRGMVDGDGNPGIHKNSGCPHIGLIGTAAVIESFHEFCGMGGTIGRSGKLSTLVFYSYNASDLAKKLYDGTDIFLDRKKVIADQIMQYEQRCCECRQIIIGRDSHAKTCSSCLPVAKRRKALEYKTKRIKEEVGRGRNPCHNCIKRDSLPGKKLCFHCNEY